MLLNFIHGDTVDNKVSIMLDNNKTLIVITSKAK